MLLTLSAATLGSTSALQSLSQQRTTASCSVEVEGVTQWGRCRRPRSVAGAIRGAALIFDHDKKLEILVPGLDSLGDEKMWPVDLSGGNTLADSFPLVPETQALLDAPIRALSLDWTYMDVSFLGTPQEDILCVSRQFFATNLAATDSAFSSCVDPATITFSPLIGSLPAQAGDLLLCTGTPTTPCTDFKWVNKSNRTLVSERPLFPEQLPTNSFYSSRCTPRPLFMTRGFKRIEILLATPMSLNNLRTQSSPSTTFSLSVDINLEGSLFIPSMLGFTGLEAMTREEIIQNTQNILLKPIYVRTRQSKNVPEDSGFFFEGTVLPSI